MASINEYLVPASDLPYYKAACVAGLKDQLRESDLPTNGRKYELYLRLCDAGQRMYTDDRSDSDPESPHDDGPGDDQGGGSEQDDDYQEGDDGAYDGADDGGDDGRGGRRGKGHGKGDGKGNGKGKGKGKDKGKGRATGKGKKRLREDDGDDDDGGDSSHDGDDDDDQEPPRNRARLIGVLPAELQDRIITSLHPSALWNLITAAPETYLSNDPPGVNALLVEANYQRRHDHPGRGPLNAGDVVAGEGAGAGPSGAAPAAAAGPRGNGLPWAPAIVAPSQTPGGPITLLPPVFSTGGPAAGDPVDPNLNRPLSLLEWVGRRALYDARWRAANRTRIGRVIDAYLTAYGDADPTDAEDQNPRDAILYYFRDRADLAGVHTLLGHAAAHNMPDVVHLLLARGADVNEVVADDETALDQAAFAILGNDDRIQAVFALLGAGANVADLQSPTIDEAEDVITAIFTHPGWDEDPDFEFPRIDNPLGLSVRQFIADERSSIRDRMTLAMFLIFYGNEDYPAFI